MDGNPGNVAGGVSMVAQKKKLKVLLFSSAFYPKVDGVAMRVRHLLTNLKKMGHDVTMLCAYEEAPESFEGTPIIKLPSFTPPLYSETRLAYPFPVFSLLKIFSELRPDVVHFVGPEFVMITFLFAVWLYRVPFLASYHWYLTAWLKTQTPSTRFLTGWIRHYQKLYNFADYVISPSMPMKEILNSENLRCNDIWPPAVESASTFHPRHKSMGMREKLTFGHPEAPLILYVGRIAVEKGLSLLPRILEVVPNAYLALIGGGDLADEWKERHGQKNRIYCEGTYWHGETLSQAYASADVFVLPSNFEALGNVILEAMASGIATIGCNAGGVPHMIKHRQNGLLFESGDDFGLATAVQELVQNPELRGTLASAGRKYAEGISWESSAAYVEGIYHRIIEYQNEGLEVARFEKFPVLKAQKTRSKWSRAWLLVAVLLVIAVFLIFATGCSTSVAGGTA